MTPVVERTQPYHQDLAVTGMVRVCYNTILLKKVCFGSYFQNRSLRYFPLKPFKMREYVRQILCVANIYYWKPLIFPVTDL